MEDVTLYYGDNVAPEVESISPSNGEIFSHPITQNLIIRFSEAMKKSSISVNKLDTSCTGSVQISNDGFATCVKFEADPTYSMFKESFYFLLPNLITDQTYSVKVTTDAMDAWGNRLEKDYTLENGFKTPSVFQITIDVTTDTSLTSSISVAFSTPLDDSTITANTSDTACSGSIQVSKNDFVTCVQMETDPSADAEKKAVTLIPASNLEMLTTYSVKVTSDIRSSEGYSINDQTHDFTTSIAGKTWTQATLSPEWSARKKFSAIVYKNKIWIIGGYNGTYLNDVWYSADGLNWTQADNSADWEARAGHTSVVYDDKMWVMGGNTSTVYKDDVWYSSDGINWSSASLNADWDARSGHAALVYDGKMWILGGTCSYYCGEYLNDAWSSSDGATWDQIATSAGWSARGFHASYVLNDAMWVAGGKTGLDVYSNDIWYSTDGINWTEYGLLSLPWGYSADLSLYGTAAVVTGNYVISMGGYIPSDNSVNNYVSYGSMELQFSGVSSTPPWESRAWHQSVAFNNRLWIMGGQGAGMENYLNDVWFSDY